MNSVGVLEVRKATEYETVHYLVRGMIALNLILLPIEIMECSIYTYTKRE